MFKILIFLIFFSFKLSKSFSVISSQASKKISPVFSFIISSAKYLPITDSLLKNISFKPSCFSFFASSNETFEPDFFLTERVFASTKSKVIRLLLKLFSSLDL